MTAGAIEETHYPRNPLDVLAQQIVAMVDAWLPPGEHDARRFLGEAEAWLASLPTTSDDYGLIHWDFCIDNLAWDKSDGQPGRYHIFDFDDAASACRTSTRTSVEKM